MDGASKFVRGDAVAGIIIVIINIIGGFVIGVMQQGMTFQDSLLTFTRLTIGDGACDPDPRADDFHGGRHTREQGRVKGKPRLRNHDPAFLEIRGY